MNRRQWMINEFLNRVQSALLILCMASVLGLTGWLIGGPAMGAFAVGMTLMLYWMNPLVSPHWVAKMHRGRPLPYHEAARIYRILEKLSGRAGLKRLPRLYHIPSNAMNAFAAGTEDNSVIGITDGLLRHLSLREVSAILAHEISHLRYNDIRILNAAGLIARLTHQLSLFGQLLLLINLPILLFGGSAMSLMAIFLLIAAPALSVLLQLALSRTREYRADLGAVELLGDPGALASALTRIQRAQERYSRWMFWPGYRPTPGSDYLRTHPATDKRIEKLLEMRNGGEPEAPHGILYPDRRHFPERRWRQWQPPLHGWKGIGMIPDPRLR